MLLIKFNQSFGYAKIPELRKKKKKHISNIFAIYKHTATYDLCQISVGGKKSNWMTARFLQTS